MQTPKAVWEDGISHPTPQPLIGEEQGLIGSPRDIYSRSQTRDSDACQACVLAGMHKSPLQGHFPQPTLNGKALLVPPLGRADTDTHAPLPKPPMARKKDSPPQYREESLKQPSGCVRQNPTI